MDEKRPERRALRLVDPDFERLVDALTDRLARDERIVRHPKLAGAVADELESRYKKVFANWVIGVVLKLATIATVAFVGAATTALWALTKIKVLDIW